MKGTQSYALRATSSRATIGALSLVCCLLALALPSTAQLPVLPRAAITGFWVTQNVAPNPLPERDPTYDPVESQPQEWDKIEAEVTIDVPADGKIYYFDTLLDCAMTLKNSVSSSLDWSWGVNVDMGTPTYLFPGRYTYTVEVYFRPATEVRREFNNTPGLSFQRLEYSYYYLLRLFGVLPAMAGDPEAPPPPQPTPILMAEDSEISPTLYRDRLNSFDLFWLDEPWYIEP